MTTTISDLTNDQLLAVFNRWTTKPVKRFEKRAIGEARLTKLLADLDDMPLERALASDEPEGNAALAEMTEASRFAMPAQPVDLTFDGPAPAAMVAETATVAAPASDLFPQEGEMATTKAKAKKNGGRIRDRFEAPKAPKPAKVRKAPASIRQGGEVEALAAGSKGAEVVRLLSRKNGATIAQLIEATGWLPHTTRAYFVALRKKGYPVTLVGKGKYQIAQEAAQAAA